MKYTVPVATGPRQIADGVKWNYVVNSSFLWPEDD